MPGSVISRVGLGLDLPPQLPHDHAQRVDLDLRDQSPDGGDHTARANRRHFRTLGSPQDSDVQEPRSECRDAVPTPASARDASPTFPKRSR